MISVSGSGLRLKSCDASNLSKISDRHLCDTCIVTSEVMYSEGVYDRLSYSFIAPEVNFSLFLL